MPKILEIEVYTHGVDATYLVRKDELLLFLVEQVICVDENLTTINRLVPDPYCTGGDFFSDAGKRSGSGNVSV